MKFIFIFFSNFSDPYVRIDLNTINNDINIDSVLTKTKKKVMYTVLFIIVFDVVG